MIEFLAWIWIGVGIVLILVEFVLPGLIVVFLGAAAVITGLLVLSGIPMTPPWQIFLWILLSGLMVVFLREEIARMFPGLEKKEYTPGENDTGEGEGVVTETVYPDKDGGRVRYQESSWAARTEDGTILESGTPVRITRRENLTLFIIRKG